MTNDTQKALEALERVADELATLFYSDQTRVQKLWAGVETVRAALEQADEKDRVMVQRLKKHQKFIGLFMDGRNEHGTHLIPLYETNLSSGFINQLEGDLIDQSTLEAEEIFKSAEALGFKDSHAIIALYRFNNDDCPYIEFDKVSEDLTTLFYGTPEEQEAEYNKLRGSNETD